MPQEKTTVVVVDDTDESREMILRMLQFDPTLEVLGTAKTGVEAIEVAQKLKPDVMIMDINMPDMDGITSTENIHKKVPFIQVVILSVQNDANYMRRAMLAGARDFLTKPPQIDELTSAVRRAGIIAQEEKAKASMVQGTTGSLVINPAGGFFPPVQGKIIAVYSPKGGCGTTMLTTNLAVALKDSTNKVAIIDSNLMFGDVTVFFNEHGKNSVMDLVDRANDLDPEIISEVMVKSKTGIDILASPNQSQFVDSGLSEPFSKIIQFLQNLYDYILIDTTPYLTEVVQTCLDAANYIILVTIQDIPAIKNTNQFLSLADQSGIGRDRILFVLNRYDKRILISPERIGESLKLPVVAAIPFEERAINYSINRGVPILIDNKGIPASKAILSLADQIREKIKKSTE